MIANGVNAAALPLADAIGVAFMLVALKRALPPSQWVDWMAARDEADALEALV